MIGRCLKCQLRDSLQWQIYTVNSVNETKLSCYLTLFIFMPYLSFTIINCMLNSTDHVIMINAQALNDPHLHNDLRPGTLTVHLSTQEYNCVVTNLVSWLPVMDQQPTGNTFLSVLHALEASSVMRHQADKTCSDQLICNTIKIHFKVIG